MRRPETTIIPMIQTNEGEGKQGPRDYRRRIFTGEQTTVPKWTPTLGNKHTEATKPAKQSKSINQDTIIRYRKVRVGLSRGMKKDPERWLSHDQAVPQRSFEN